MQVSSKNGNTKLRNRKQTLKKNKGGSINISIKKNIN